MFADKITIITEGGSGIGRSLASTLSNRGAKVVVADIKLDAAKEAAAACREGRADAMVVDVTDATAVQNLVKETVDRHGRLDYMFNNAGTFVVDEMHDVPPKDWRRVIDVNLWGTIHGTCAAYQVMKEQNSGHIVNIASGYGLTPAPMLIPYSTSKYGIVGLSRALRVEAAKFGIKVTVVCPGFVKSPMLEEPETGKGPDRVWVKDVLDVLPSPFIKPCSIEDATRNIIRGVERNKRVVAFPWYVPFLAWLHQNIPGIGELALRDMTAKIRKKVKDRQDKVVEEKMKARKQDESSAPAAHAQK